MACHDCSKYSLAFTVLSAFKFEPIHDIGNPNLVIGTKVTVLQMADFGGYIPKWLLKKLVPKALGEFMDDYA
jgi:hypothetical protein